MMVTIIAAIAKNNALGKNNDLIWHLPADLKRFKNITTGHYIIMGRNTFESIGRPLPNRTTIIVTRNKDYFKDGCLIANSLEEALEMANDQEHVFLIGGAQIYKYAMERNLVDTLDITLVHDEFEADVFFPEIDADIWQQVENEYYTTDEKNKLNYSFIRYKKIAN